MFKTKCLFVSSAFAICVHVFYCSLSLKVNIQSILIKMKTINLPVYLSYVSDSQPQSFWQYKVLCVPYLYCGCFHQM